MSEEKTLECELFDCEDWDQVDTMFLTYTGITLVRDLGPFKAGEKFRYANISFNSGILELGNDLLSNKVYTFSLTLTATFIS